MTCQNARAFFTKACGFLAVVLMVQVWDGNNGWMSLTRGLLTEATCTATNIGVFMGLAHNLAQYGPMVISVQVLCLRCLKSQRFIKHHPDIPPQFVPNSKECHQHKWVLIAQRHRLRYCKWTQCRRDLLKSVVIEGCLTCVLSLKPVASQQNKPILIAYIVQTGIGEKQL